MKWKYPCANKQNNKILAISLCTYNYVLNVKHLFCASLRQFRFNIWHPVSGLKFSVLEYRNLFQQPVVVGIIHCPIVIIWSFSLSVRNYLLPITNRCCDFFFNLSHLDKDAIAVSFVWPRNFTPVLRGGRFPSTSLWKLHLLYNVSGRPEGVLFLYKV